MRTNPREDTYLTPIISLQCNRRKFLGPPFDKCIESKPINKHLLQQSDNPTLSQGLKLKMKFNLVISSLLVFISNSREQDYSSTRFGKMYKQFSCLQL